MAFELGNNQRGRTVIKDNSRSIQLEDIAGMPGEGFLFEFSYKGKKYACKL